MRNDSSSPSFQSAENVGDRRGLEAGDRAQQVVGLRDQLHVGVLDAVVHHLHEVAGPADAHVGAAGVAVDVRRDRLHDRAEPLVGLVGAADHDRRTVQRAHLAAGDAGADEVQPVLLELLLAPDRVAVVGVAAVDDDVAVLEQRHQVVDHGVGGGAGLDHDQDDAGLLDGCHELLEALGAHEVTLVADLLEHRGHSRGRAVVDGDGVTVAGDVAGQVAAHHRQPGQSDGGGGC